MTATFTTGNTYKARSIGDADCIFTAEVISRTAKTATVKVPMYGVKRVKIRVHNGEETMFALGQYSMCPVFRASAVA